MTGPFEGSSSRPFQPQAFSVLFWAVLAVLQGTFRGYYLILIYFPLMAMLATLAINGRPDEILRAAWRVLRI